VSRIPQDFLDALLARVSLVELIGSRVALKRKGREYAACCPFHAEKTPSFYVNPDKGFYHCFGCGAHGSALTFLMEHDRLSFREAVETLAAMAGMQVPEESGQSEQRGRLDPLYAALAECQRRYAGALGQAPEAHAYLQGRGLDAGQIERFGLGYAPPGGQFLKPLAESGERVTEALLDTGMSFRNDRGQWVDRFRGRVMFPIRDRRGRVIGFGGRILGSGQPKYLNSPETPLFHKGHELYGLFEATHARFTGPAIVVEGYLDVIALHQFGLTGAMATLGTAFTAEQAERLLRLGQGLVLCFDGDNAGRRAAARAVETLLPVLRPEAEVRLLFLPEGEDPDTLVRREGADGFRTRLARRSVAVADYWFAELANRFDPGTAAGRPALARAVLEGCRPCRPELQAVWLERLAQLVEQPVAQLRQWAAAARPPPAPPAHTAGRARLPALMQAAIAWVWHHPEAHTDLAAVVPELESGDIPGAAILAALCLQLPHIPAEGRTRWLAQLPEEIGADAGTRALIDALSEHPPPPVAGEDIPRYSQDLAAQLRRLAHSQRLSQLTAQARDGTLSPEERTELETRLQQGKR